MEWHIPPSLYELILVKIVVNAWNVADFTTIKPPEYVDKDCKLRENTQKVLGKIALLPLPKAAQQDLITLVRPIGLQILSWIEYHECFFNKTGCSANAFVPHITWTQRGTIDQSITIEDLIDSEQLLLTDSFQVACIYCRETRIRNMWQQFGNDLISVLSSILEELPPLVSFWYHRLLDNLTYRPIYIPLWYVRGYLWRNHHSHLDRYGFALAIWTKNDIAVRWFWKNIESGLSREQRANFLIDGIVFIAEQRPILTYTPPMRFPNEHCVQILMFLLSQMSEENTKNLREKLSAIGGSAELLKYMLDWPYQKCLTKLARIFGGSLGPNEYTKVLLKIIDKIENVYETECDYGELFSKFWDENKALNGQLDHAQIAELLVRLINIDHITNRDVQNMKAVIGEVIAVENQKLVQESLQKVCFAMVKRGLWSLFEMLLRNRVGPEHDLNELKLEIFELVGQNICKDLIVIDKNWKLVAKFAEWSNLSKESIVLLIQDLESHYKNRKRKLGQRRVLAKKQSR